MDLTRPLPPSALSRAPRPAWLPRARRRVVNALRRAYVAFDRFNCWRYGVWEFDDGDRCVLRLSAERSDAHLCLEDGTEVRPGDRLLRLHYWNEHIPPKEDGPSVGWAARFGARLRASLHGVGHHLRERSDLGDVVAVVAETSILAEDDIRRVTQFYRRLGFEVDLPSADSPGARLHQRLRNVHVWLLIWSVNPASARGRSPMGVRRMHLRMSRGRFLARWGAGEQPPV